MRRSPLFTIHQMIRILVLISLFTFQNATAQTWQRLIENPFSAGGAQAYGIRVLDDTIYVSSAFIVIDSIPKTRATLSKHSLENGELLNAEVYYDPAFQHALFSQTYEGTNQLYDTGNDLFYLPLNPYNDSQYPIINTKLLTIDKNLNVVSEYPIPSEFDDNIRYGNGTRVDQDGNIFIFGARSNWYVNDVDSANTWLVKMTPQGEHLWSQRYPNTHTITFLKPMSDGDIVFNCNSDFPSLQNQKEVVKTNALGERQWSIEFGGMYPGPRSAIEESSEGKIILANDWNHFYVDELGEGWWYRKWIQIQKIQDLGETYVIEEDRKYAYTTNLLEVFGIEEMPNNDLLLWGHMQNTAGDTYDTINQIWTKPVARGFIMRVNENLDSLWLRTYYPPDDDLYQWFSEYYISDVAPLNDGGFVTSGWGSIRDLGNLNQVWLMRLDEYGCLEPGCQNINVTEIAMGLENSMTVFPNPVNHQCIIQWNVQTTQTKEHNFANTELIITDLQGKEVLRILIDNFSNNLQKNIDLSDLPSGLYQAHWVKGSMWLDSLKIVKE